MLKEIRVCTKFGAGYNFFSVVLIFMIIVWSEGFLIVVNVSSFLSV
jgi:hypothetical protein